MCVFLVDWHIRLWAEWNLFLNVHNQKLPCIISPRTSQFCLTGELNSLTQLNQAWWIYLHVGLLAYNELAVYIKKLGLFLDQVKLHFNKNHIKEFIIHIYSFTEVSVKFLICGVYVCACMHMHVIASGIEDLQAPWIPVSSFNTGCQERKVFGEHFVRDRQLQTKWK